LKPVGNPSTSFMASVTGTSWTRTASANSSAIRAKADMQGVGARTVQALAMVAEVVHGTPCRFSDPARFSFAHGGKDRHPFAVPLTVYDETIRVLKSAVQNAKLGREEALGALRRLDEQARRLESLTRSPAFDAVVAEENRKSFECGGRSVFDGRSLPAAAQPKEWWARSAGAPNSYGDELWPCARPSTRGRSIGRAH
jgi:hypothetical protein